MAINSALSGGWARGVYGSDQFYASAFIRSNMSRSVEGLIREGYQKEVGPYRQIGPSGQILMCKVKVVAET